MEIYINDIEYRLDQNYKITEQAGGTAVMSVVIKIDDQVIPEPFDSVAIYDDGDLAFSGVVGIPESPTYNTGLEPKRYTLQIQSNNALLRRRSVSEAYQGKTTTYIVNDLFTNYVEGEGITLGGISDLTFEYEAYTAGRLFLADVLDELATTVAAVWHVDNEKKFWFLTKNDFTSIEAPSHIMSLKKKVSGLDTRTVQIIQGAAQQTSIQTKTITYVDEDSFTMDYPLSLTPDITINGDTAGVGVKGLDDSDSAKTFLWTYNSSTISINPAATIIPVDTDTLVFDYYGFFSIDVELQNGARIAEIAARTGSSGRIDNVVQDSTITSFDDGNNTAAELLQKYGDADETISCVTDDIEGTDPLTIWTFDKPELDISGEYVIVERSRSRFTEDKPRVELQLKNNNFYMRYGTIYNKYDKNIKKLNVRGDSVVIKSDAGIVDQIDVSNGFLAHEGDIVYYATDGDQTDPGLYSYPFYPAGA